ncbi:arylsulfatase H [Pteropus alecto]|uniref:arylsulfatase H n=1 Tax=Pteropus alecto TaxID=9402 RepID=UPI0007685FC4|nr:arylsulfatase H [Pteropus alecto]
MHVIFFCSHLKHDFETFCFLSEPPRVGPRVETGEKYHFFLSCVTFRNRCLWMSLCCWFGGLHGTFVTRSARPNIVLLMADDLGLGDLSCYGNNTLSTPNIDRLASEGVRLTQHLAAASACSPSRAAFLTGRYPVRSGMASAGDRNRALPWLGASAGLPSNETTFAELLQRCGYRTGLVGQWHLGLSCVSRDDHCHHPRNHGFDHFYGLPFGLLSDCQASGTPELHRGLRVRLWVSTAALGLVPVLLLVPRLARWLAVPWKVIVGSALLAALFFAGWYSSYGFVRRWNCILMRDHEIVQQPLREERVASLMLLPPLLWVVKYKRGPFLLLLSFLHVHTPLTTRDKFVGRSKHGRYGDNVEEMDWMVGGEGMGGWEGGIRVPGIFRWPNVLEAGRVIDEPTSLMDIYPTLSHVAGGVLPQDRAIDGRNLMPLLEGRARHSDHDFLFHYCGVYLHAVRWHQRDCATVWKLHYVTPKFSPEGAGACYDSGLCSCSGDVTHHDPPLLFDVSRDPSESRPLDPDHEALFHPVVKKIEAALREHRGTLAPAPPQLSLWHTVWKPWLQPCCGTFPFCGCDKEGDVPPRA